MVIMLLNSWAQPVYKCTLNFHRTEQLLCLHCEQSFRVNHQICSLVLISVSCSSRFILGNQTAEVSVPDICKNFLWYWQSWESLQKVSSFYSFPFNASAMKSFVFRYQILIRWNNQTEELEMNHNWSHQFCCYFQRRSIVLSIFHILYLIFHILFLNIKLQ